MRLSCHGPSKVFPAPLIRKYAREKVILCSRWFTQAPSEVYAKPAGASKSAEASSAASSATSAKSPPSIEDGHSIGESLTANQSFDQFLEKTAMTLFNPEATSVLTLYSQYRERAGRVLDSIVPYEERPVRHRRADVTSEEALASTNAIGDGIVMVVHVLSQPDTGLQKICACSGFVVNAQSISTTSSQVETIITCAHTLEEIRRHMSDSIEQDQCSFSLIIPSVGEARLVTQVLSSMPRSDIIAIEAAPATDTTGPRLRSLPLSPFPVYNGESVLTHLFNTSVPPPVNSSGHRLPQNITRNSKNIVVQSPVMWPRRQAWRRWGAGVMLGYRSYTGIEVEAGIHSSLPHIQTSVLPTPGSSGGPLVSEAGAVIGMISGRRMDNRVEGERGWGASAEGIFEMFSLPGFTPTGKK